jgi:hypothetical protein
MKTKKKPAGVKDPRLLKALDIRVDAATCEALIPVPPHTTNGDEQRYPDKSASYTKCLKQDGPGVVNLKAWKSLRDALNSGKPADFEKIILGGARPLNGPQGALAFTLVGTDSSQFGNAPSHANQEKFPVVPVPPPLASEAYGTELVDLYWCSLLRDVAFTDYPTNSLALAAARELNTMPTYAGPRSASGKVTPDLLFRGGFPGETIGPYISQFFIRPTDFGAQPLTQQFKTYLPSFDYMTDLVSWQAVQSGISSGLVNQVDTKPRYLHDGRGLAAYTHVDVLYQAYFTAYLVLNSLKAPLNPGNPYSKSKTQNGFGTFGQPDIAATLAAVSKVALNAVWYQKWIVHLRHRPESGGGIVELTKTGKGATIDGTVNENVLNSVAVQKTCDQYGSCLLPEAFPEGSPAHPAYPTGHGAVGGACITVLKFFFDGTFIVPGPLVPATDGLSLLPYKGKDAGSMTVDGELNKIAHNVTFGHGLHGGIHWRSDSDASMVLGEAVAISYLQDMAQTCNEKFKVQFTKLDGSIATITNK